MKNHQKNYYQYLLKEPFDPDSAPPVQLDELSFSGDTHASSLALIAIGSGRFSLGWC
jgi:hypothetical protein